MEEWWEFNVCVYVLCMLCVCICVKRLKTLMYLTNILRIIITHWIHWLHFVELIKKKYSLVFDKVANISRMCGVDWWKWQFYSFEGPYFTLFQCFIWSVDIQKKIHEEIHNKNHLSVVLHLLSQTSLWSSSNNRPVRLWASLLIGWLFSTYWVLHSQY